jgi:anti-sigma28 factor (negative regulator of flagellin synthesis)
MVSKSDNVGSVVGPITGYRSVGTVPEGSTEPAKASPEPAAKLQLSDTAVVSRNPSVVAEDEQSDSRLIDEIRQRLADGTFRINYEGVAISLLGDAAARFAADKR